MKFFDKEQPDRPSYRVTGGQIQLLCKVVFEYDFLDVKVSDIVDEY